MTRALAAALAVSLALVVSGCGSKSIDELVSDRYDVANPRCKAVGASAAGKIYSCQSKSGGTVCVIRDGDDLLPGSLEAQRAGVSC